MMLGWIRSLLRRENGVAAMELGLATPIFLLMFLSASELGHMIYYSITIEKGMRSGVTYAARNELHLITDPTKLSEIEQKTINLTMTGTMDGLGDYLVPGYEKALAEGAEPVTMSTKLYTKTLTGNLGTVTVTIVVLSVDVPYIPLVPFVTENFMGTSSPSIRLTHEQAIIGD